MSAILKSSYNEKDFSLTCTIFAYFVWFSLHSRYFPIGEEGTSSACRQCSSRSLFPVQRQGSRQNPTRNGSVLPSNVYTFILFRCVIANILLPFCITDTYTEASVWHRTVTEKRDFNTSCWCVCFSCFQLALRMALNYCLSQCWKQVRQCWQT